MTKAFTLVESLVTIFIIALLSLIILPNYSSTSQQLALQRSAFKLAQDVRRVQEMAMSVEVFEGEIPEGGYGLYINKNDPVCPDHDCYHFYVDISSPFGKYDSGDQLIETIYLEKEIYIKNLVPSSANYSINFKSPDPITEIRDQAGQDKQNVTITIAINGDSSKTKDININKAGLINIE